MLKNSLTIVFRNVMKNKLYFFINIFGMGIAIACCVVAYLSFRFNSEFDRIHENAGVIYRVNSLRASHHSGITSTVVPVPLGELIKNNLGDVNEVVRFSSAFGNFRVKEEVFNTSIDYFDPHVFDLFTFKFLEGSPDAIKDKTKIILSEQLAKRLFGREPALGKIITRTDFNELQQFEVGGVFADPPANSSFQCKSIMNYQVYLDIASLNEKNHWKLRNTLFLVIKDRSRVKTVADALMKYANENNQLNPDFVIDRFALDPFAGMAARDDRENRMDRRTAGVLPPAAVIGPGIMALFILLIACFNFINTFLFLASSRLKEIGIRKVLGGIRAQLIAQSLGETFVTCLLSICVGLLLAELLIPAYNQMWPMLKLDLSYATNFDVYFFLGILLMFITIASGAYPAFYVSHFQPNDILTGKYKFGNPSFLTYMLLTLQFIISGAGLISAVAFYQNAQYQQRVDLGYNQQGVIFVPIMKEDFPAYKNALTSNSKILSIGGARDHFNIRPYGMKSAVKADGKEAEVTIAEVSDGYLKTCDIELILGRDFTENSDTDKRESVIITENLVRQFGWREPLGKEIQLGDTSKVYVVGVIKNVLSRGLWEKPEVLMLRYRPDRLRFLFAKTSSSNLAEVGMFMKSVWSEKFPNQYYKGVPNDLESTKSNMVNKNIVEIFLFLGITALILAASGLFTLVSLTVVRKLKDISIRKIWGAPIFHIVKKVCGQFVVLLLIASVFGIYLAKFLTRLLMHSLWENYLPAGAFAFITSTAIVFVIAAFTLRAQIRKIMALNPADVLKEW